MTITYIPQPILPALWSVPQTYVMSVYRRQYLLQLVPEEVQQGKGPVLVVCLTNGLTGWLAKGDDVLARFEEQFDECPGEHVIYRANQLLECA